MGRVNRKSTLSLKTRCRSPKTVPKRKFPLLARNPLVKNVVSIAQNCSETQISFARAHPSRYKNMVLIAQNYSETQISFARAQPSR